MLHIQLFGNFQLMENGIPVAGVVSARLQALLAYLLLHRHTPQARQHLAFLFWPDSPEAQALTNLRKQLLFLRRTLPEADSFLRIDARAVQWQPNAPFTLDVAEFEQSLARSTTVTSAEAIDALQTAINCYGGDLLPGCYDDWIIAKRELLREQYSQALERLALLLEDQREYPAAIQIGQQLLRHDPLHETTYRRLMRLHALNGDRATALHTYHLCVTVLQTELGVEPGANTQAAYERLLQQQIPFVLRHQAPPVVEQPRLVGRQVEWARVQEIWRSVTRGHAQLLLLSGEAGIGKTRLSEELLHWAERQGVTTAYTRAYAAEGRLAYAPLIEWLRTPALKSAMKTLDLIWVSELARLLPELLTEHPGLPLPNPRLEGWQRHHLFEALVYAMLAGKQPLLLILDDLQWCDQETLEWLHFLLRYNPQAPLLIVGTVRPAEIGPRHPLLTLRLGLRDHQQVTELKLAALNAADTCQLAQQMIGAELDRTLATTLYRDTEGNPLFIVEIMRAHRQEQNIGNVYRETTAAEQTPSPNPQALPPKVQTVIEERLAQLSPLARKLADLAAVIGRNFTFDVLVRASDFSEDELVSGLDELWQRHIVREQEANVYDFSHDKIREVVYNQVSATRRRLFHRRIAQALAIVYEANLDRVSAQLAAHYEKAGVSAQAILYYQQAARAALRVYANHEAIDHFTSGLALLTNLPDSVDKAQQELTFLIGLGSTLVTIRGYTFSQVGEVYMRAQILAQKLGLPQDPAILRALAIFYIGRRQYRQAHEQGAQILALAQQAEAYTASLLLVEGYYVRGVTSFWQGEFLQAKAALAQALAHYDVQYHESHITLYSQDPGVVCLIRLALTLAQLGYLEQAEQMREEALALARRLAHPFTLAYALAFACWLSSDLGDKAALTTHIETALAHCQKHGIQYWLPMAQIFQGRLLAEQGQSGAAITQIRTAITAYQTIQADVYRPQCLVLLAQAYVQAGEVEQALAVLDEGLATVANYGDRCYEAELHRRKGECLALISTAPSVVEACFQHAYTVSRQQQAKLLELRAAMSLGRFWAQQGKCAQARQLLAETYDWFTEGFDTIDLQQAQALLAELA